MKTLSFISCALLFLLSCSSPREQTDTSDSAGKPAATDPATAATSKTFRGLYVHGDNIHVFYDCESRKKIYWIDDSLASLKQRYNETNRMPSYPGESVYAEVRGYLKGKATSGAAADYQNVLVVTDILKVEAKNFRSDCYNYEFIAIGNEPFWSLDIMPDEGRIVLKDVGENRAIEFTYSPARISGGTHRYEVTDKANQKLIAVIRKESCSDGMSDRQYHYSAEITFNGAVYRGCAIKKGDQFPDRP